MQRPERRARSRCMFWEQILRVRNLYGKLFGYGSRGVTGVDTGDEWTFENMANG